MEATLIVGLGGPEGVDTVVLEELADSGPVVGLQVPFLEPEQHVLGQKVVDLVEQRGVCEGLCHLDLPYDGLAEELPDEGQSGNDAEAVIHAVVKCLHLVGQFGGFDYR